MLLTLTQLHKRSNHICDTENHRTRSQRHRLSNVLCLTRICTSTSLATTECHTNVCARRSEGGDGRSSQLSNSSRGPTAFNQICMHILHRMHTPWPIVTVDLSRWIDFSYDQALEIPPSSHKLHHVCVRARLCESPTKIIVEKNKRYD